MVDSQPFDDSVIDALLAILYEKGCVHDSTHSDRSRLMLNITPSTGRFLDLLVSDSRPKRILEIGTSNGYSTIWLARAARRIGAQIVTVDCSAEKHHAAKQHLRDAGLADVVSLHTMDGGDFLASSLPASYDFVFLDSDRSRYVDWTPLLLRAIDFGTLVVDNAISHRHELSGFCRLLEAQSEINMVALPIGKGQLVVRSTANESNPTA